MKFKEYFYGKFQVCVIWFDCMMMLYCVFVVLVDIVLEGDFELSYMDGDNCFVVVIDMMKNIVYVFVCCYGDCMVEQLVMWFVEYFIDEYEYVEVVMVDVEEEFWILICVGDCCYDDVFLWWGLENVVVIVLVSFDGMLLMGGFVGIQVMKILKFGFVNFYSDEYCIFVDIDDCFFVMIVDVQWCYYDDVVEFGVDDFYCMCLKVCLVLFGMFVEYELFLVQQMFFEMGMVVFECCGVIFEIFLVMLNQYYLFVDFGVFGFENDNEVFVGMNELFGYIEVMIIC